MADARGRAVRECERGGNGRKKFRHIYRSTGVVLANLLEPEVDLACLEHLARPENAFLDGEIVDARAIRRIQVTHEYLAPEQDHFAMASRYGRVRDLEMVFGATSNPVYTGPEFECAALLDPVRHE
jgi:hypothetical protein